MAGIFVKHVARTICQGILLVIWISGAFAQNGLVTDREVGRALRVYEHMLALHPQGDQVRSGFVRLTAGDTAGALSVFQDVLAHYEAFAPAHYGMALVSFRIGQAAVDKSAFVQRTSYHAERAAVLFPDFEGPYRLMGQMQLDVLEDYDRAVDAYIRCIETAPTPDIDTFRNLARAFLHTDALPHMDTGMADSLLATDRSADLLPLVALACLDRNLPELAMQYFGRFFSQSPPEERQLYQDIRAIASEEEQKAYEQTEGDAVARREFMTRFWAGRDPDLMTGVNERQVAHYGRVWFASANFSKSSKPYDRRGEVYIRYGSPDYRSTSNHPVVPMSAAVERIKERLAVALYGEEGLGEVSAGPTFPILVQIDPGMNFPDFSPVDQGSAPLSDAVTSDPVLGVEDVSPDVRTVQAGQVSDEVTRASRYGRVGGEQDMSFVRWESWVYTRVAGGIEVVFVDVRGDGKFDYAPVPPPDPAKTDAVRQMSRLVTHSPQVVMQRSVEQMPEYYMPGGTEAFLDFYYDRADFRGSDGKTRMEIYYGLSPKMLSTMVRTDTTFVYVGCASALLDPISGDVRQVHEDGLYRTSGDMSGVKGDFIPNQLTIDVAPGTYELRVQVKDLISGKSGIYKESLTVEDYSGPSLQISDLQMGWRVLTEGGIEKYKKGDVWVIPMTTKAYHKGQNPFVYYEIYNLTRDSFGQCRFRLDYTIQYEPEKDGGLGRFMASVGRVFRKGDVPEVSVSAEQMRSETDLKEFFELDLKRIRGGVNRLSVMVTDLTSGKSSQKEVLFRFE